MPGTRLIGRRELKRDLELLGAKKLKTRLVSALRRGHLKPNDFRIRELFECVVPDGEEAVRLYDPRNYGSSGLLEAAQAVDTSLFSNITGQLLFTEILDALPAENLIGDSLCTVKPTQFSGEKIPGISRQGDNVEVVDEAQPYPELGVQEEWIETPVTTKRGGIVSVTKEAIFHDRTGFLYERAKDVGLGQYQNREKRILQAVTGATNTYKRMGVSLNTYLTSGAWTNSSAITLDSWNAIAQAELLFDGMTDPNTGEPIQVIPYQLLVPSALTWIADQILTATQVGRIDNQANANTIRMMGANPVRKNRIGQAYEVMSNRYVKYITGSAAYWYFGDFKRAFWYMENWGVTVAEAPPNSHLEFERDIVARFKVSEKGTVAVREPRLVAKLTGS